MMTDDNHLRKTPKIRQWFLQINSYLQEGFRQIRSYLLEPFWQTRMVPANRNTFAGPCSGK